ncbi:MAG TPA: GNAT family N-acetyltransferase [Ktedonobacterales bacterium]|nr:GNAT family N-acetyltransferase [Ktedonobacterales bacterium]
MFLVRPAQEADAAAVTELINRDYGEPATVEQVRARILAASASRQALRLVAVSERGDVVAYGHVLRDDWMQPGLFWMHMVVDAETRRRGIGTRLCDALFEWAGERGGATYRAEARDNMPESLRFAERRGFQIDRHIFESALDLTTFDERPFVTTLDATRAAGIRFFSLADLGDTMDARRSLYEVERVIARDIPGGSESATRPFEIFLREVCDPAHYRPEAQLVAADGEEWVGLASVLDYPANASMYNGVTGVLPAYRGRGIATALKLLALRAARTRGAATIRTNNDSENAPMLAINRRLGYQPEPGYYRLLRTIAV